MSCNTCQKQVASSGVMGEMPDTHINAVYATNTNIERCPNCGAFLDKNGVCQNTARCSGKPVAQSVKDILFEEAGAANTQKALGAMGFNFNGPDSCDLFTPLADKGLHYYAVPSQDRDSNEHLVAITTPIKKQTQGILNAKKQIGSAMRPQKTTFIGHHVVDGSETRPEPVTLACFRVRLKE